MKDSAMSKCIHFPIFIEHPLCTSHSSGFWTVMLLLMTHDDNDDSDDDDDDDDDDIDRGLGVGPEIPSGLHLLSCSSCYTSAL